VSGWPLSVGPHRGHHAKCRLGSALQYLMIMAPWLASPEGGIAPRARTVSCGSWGLSVPASFIGGSDIFRPVPCSPSSWGSSPSSRLRGGGDLGLADPGVDCAPLFTAFWGASSTEAALCFQLMKG